MDETALQLYRRQRLDEAINHLTAGNVTAFGRLLGYRDGAFVRQMLSGSRAVSDKTVRAIETLRGMRAWFQTDGEPPLQAGSGTRPIRTRRPARAGTPCWCWRCGASRTWASGRAPSPPARRTAACAPSRSPTSGWSAAACVRAT